MLTVVPTPAAVGEDDHSSLVIDEIVREDAGRCWRRRCRPRATATSPSFVGEVDEDGRRLMVRNGYHQPREVMTSAGAVGVVLPRVNDKRTDPDTGERRRFASSILPPWCDVGCLGTYGRIECPLLRRRSPARPKRLLWLRR